MDKSTTVALTKDLKQRAQKLAQERDRSLGYIIRKALEEYLPCCGSCAEGKKCEEVAK